MYGEEIYLFDLNNQKVVKSLISSIILISLIGGTILYQNRKK